MKYVITMKSAFEDVQNWEMDPDELFELTAEDMHYELPWNNFKRVPDEDETGMTMDEACTVYEMAAELWAMQCTQNREELDRMIRAFDKAHTFDLWNFACSVGCDDAFVVGMLRALSR